LSKFIFIKKRKKWTSLIDALFVMVAQNPDTGKPEKINTLKITSNDEMERNVQGEKNKERRINSRNKSLNKIPPSVDEIQILHDFFTNKGNLNLENSVSMDQTQLRNILFCQPQECNVNYYNYKKDP
jgi:hypothetical protein